jgi:hypothetical protein
MTPHPQYPHHFVYDGRLGERPVVGEFYFPKSGDTMLKIAGKAWGSAYSKLSYARLINANPWNRANLTYRDSDSDCTAPVIPSTGAANAAFGTGPWIALGCPSQAIWIPHRSNSDEVPEAKSSDKPKPPTTTSPEFGIPGTGGGDSPATAPKFEAAVPGGEESKASLGPSGKTGWIILGVLAAVGTGIYIYNRKKGR